MNRRLVGPPSVSSLRAYSHLPIYVVLGVQGAGTNLLCRLLSTVFDFSVLKDHALVFDAARRLGRRPTRAHVTNEIAAFTRHLRPSLLRSRRMIRGIRDVRPFAGIEHVMRPELVQSGAQFARFVYAYRAAATSAQHLAIKSDDIWEHLDEIDEVLPNRRVILLIRDFRDNAVSVTRKPFGPVDPVCAALYVKKRFRVYERAYQRAGGSGFLARFENIVEHPGQFAHDLSAWCGIAVPDLMHHDLRSKLIRPGRVGRWRTMHATSLRQCEGVLQRELRQYGYPRAFVESQPPTRPELLAAQTRDLAGRVRQKVTVAAAKLGLRHPFLFSNTSPPRTP